MLPAGVQVWRYSTGTGHSFVYWPGKMSAPVQCFNPRQAANAIMRQEGWKEVRSKFCRKFDCKFDGKFDGKLNYDCCNTAVIMHMLACFSGVAAMPYRQRVQLLSRVRQEAAGWCDTAGRPSAQQRQKVLQLLCVAKQASMLVSVCCSLQGYTIFTWVLQMHSFDQRRERMLTFVLHCSCTSGTWPQ
jgi:hypothetical protein